MTSKLVPIVLASGLALSGCGNAYAPSSEKQDTPSQKTIDNLTEKILINWRGENTHYLVLDSLIRESNFQEAQDSLIAYLEYQKSSALETKTSLRGNGKISEPTMSLFEIGVNGDIEKIDQALKR